MKTLRERPWFLILMVMLLVQFFFLSKNSTTKITYSDFLQKLNHKEIENIVVAKDQIEGTLKTSVNSKPSHFIAYKIEDPTLIDKLKESGIPFSGVPESSWFYSLLSWAGTFLLLIFFWRFVFGRVQSPQSEILSFGKSKAKVYVERDLKTKFSDVAGVDEAKTELQEVVDFLKAPEKFNRLGGRMPKGILLVGPPGTGKTLLARAVAGEAGVSFFSINGSEFVELFVGLGAARVRDLFQQARKSVPCILFIDELDALGKARGISAISGGANEEKEQTLNQLLAEIDGFDPSPGIVLLAATNRPEILDPALLRSGRFDRQIAIDKPDKKGRVDILKIHLKKIKISESVQVDEIAGVTPGFSGADLENLVNEAALAATRRQAADVESVDFTSAVERIVGGLERKSRILSEDERRRVAFHEMGHATVSLALGAEMETIHKVSIIPRGIGALGYTMRRPIEDRYLMSQTELQDKLAILMGGRAAETYFFKDCSTGAADDLDKATDMSRAMVMQYGMGESTGFRNYERITDPYLKMQLTSVHEFSEETALKIDREVKSFIECAYEKAIVLIQINEKFINKSVELLLKKESLNESELNEVWIESKIPDNGEKRIDDVNRSNQKARLGGTFHASP